MFPPLETPSHQLHTPAHGQGPLQALSVLLPGLLQLAEDHQHRQTPVVLATKGIILQHLVTTEGERGDTGHQGLCDSNWYVS